MKKYLWMLAVILFVISVGTLGILFAGFAGPIEAGVAAAVKGEVKTTPEGAAGRPLKSGDKVYMGDTIETGQDGQLQVLLLDQTVFTLGPLSALKMDKFAFDPVTDDGKVTASMVKGIFRVVSGKVAHKKPENMTLDLPAGAIGFRGTNVAGIIDGAKSLVVLLGPVGTGRISVSNVVNGETVAVEIDEAGKGTIVGGPNVAPLPVFQISAEDLARIANALGQKMNGDGEMAGTGTTGPAGGSVNSQDLLDLLNTVDRLNQQSTEAAQDMAANTSRNEHRSESEGRNQGQYNLKG